MKSSHANPATIISSIILIVFFAVAIIFIQFLLPHLDMPTFSFKIPNLSFNNAASTTAVTTEVDSDFQSNDIGSMTYYNGNWYQLKNHVESVLVIGLDKNASDVKEGVVYRNTQQSDFLMLLVFDKDAGTASAIQINRDTMTDIPRIGIAGTPMDSFYGQLALSHTYGNTGREACRNTVTAVSKFLYGTKIDHYISFTMDAIPIINDCSDGVTLTLLDDFSHIREDFTKGTEVTLQGEDALLYVRARSGMDDSTNLHRMERQKQYLFALFERLRNKSEEDASFPINTLLSVSDYLVSDCTIDQLSVLAQLALDSEFDEIHDIPGEAVFGGQYMEFHANDGQLQDMIMNTFYQPTTLGE